MFENILGQRVTRALEHDVVNQCLSPSMLLAGNEYTGKLTAALELARALSCSQDGRWGCTCESCKSHKELFTRDMLILGARDHPLEIRASAAAFLSAPTQASFYLFLRSVRKLTARFNAFLWDDDDTRPTKAAPIIDDLEERFRVVRAEFTAGHTEKLPPQCEKITGLCEKLQQDCMYNQILITHVRNLSSWVRLTPHGEKKIVIVDNADRMHESARNAFLKILEEPPAYAHFILTTSRRAAMLPTILSRVRTYTFDSRTSDIQESVITRVFRGTPTGTKNLIASYLYQFLPVSVDTIKQAAVLFVHSVLHLLHEEKKTCPPAIAAVVQEVKSLQEDAVRIPALLTLLDKAASRTVFSLFLKEILNIFSAALHRPECTTGETVLYTSIAFHVRKTHTSVTVFNSSVQAALEDLQVRIRDCLCGNL